MNHVMLRGYAITREGERFEIGESGKAERMLGSLKYYIENFQRVVIQFDYEDEEAA
jgi:hypothetical protein